MAIAFIDLQAQRKRIEPQINAAVQKVIESGAYIMGPEVKQFETALAAFSGAKHALGCANGTDAIALPLMAWGVGEGDAVFCPSFTFCATGEVVPWVNATPVFVDIEPDTYNINPDHLVAQIERVLKEGKLKPRVIIGVCLFGQAANYPRLREIADTYGLKLIADSAQGFGTTINGRHPSDWADCVTTSFFPAKPLGCYGDGGGIVTNDSALAEIIDSLRVHGKAVASDLKGKTFEHDPKYLNIRVGMNSRLDTIQAAVLIEKLNIFADEIVLRNKVAARYNELLKPHVAAVPFVKPGVISTWAQYTIEHDNRDGLAAHLKAQDIPTAVYYPVPMHLNQAYREWAPKPGELAVTEAKAERVISLPMHPYLDTATQDRIVDAVRAFNG
ncbi:DegT/DnrJ/EryC1/StrS family aminotransferase [Hyphomonas sp.]|jgi:dTDP-4-amino-4,6-dideoxygalactose transaminase|uniref:DegT/DnrJ/EryC1/StrS family aminotransferase n=1 Tax=Hyphomonas sp. TaxID=87 RepID=UPI00391C45C2